MTVSKEQIESALEQVRPGLQQDGGDVELVDVKGNKVFLRLLGHCRGCPYSQMTLRNGIEAYFKKNLSPDLEVIGVD